LLVVEVVEEILAVVLLPMGEEVALDLIQPMPLQELLIQVVGEDLLVEMVL
jgi:hypothetical protein